MVLLERRRGWFCLGDDPRCSYSARVCAERACRCDAGGSGCLSGEICEEDCDRKVDPCSEQHAKGEETEGGNGTKVGFCVSFEVGICRAGTD